MYKSKYKDKHKALRVKPLHENDFSTGLDEPITLPSGLECSVASVGAPIDAESLADVLMNNRPGKVFLTETPCMTAGPSRYDYYSATAASMNHRKNS
jgi:hypothetical protein